MGTISRDQIRRALHPVATPITLDAAAMPGASVLGDDGKVYTAIRWPGAADDFSWQSSATAIRAQGTAQKITVNRNATEVEGSNYHTLETALRYATSLYPVFQEGSVAEDASGIYVEVAAAHGNIQEQILLVGVNAGHVALTAENAVVTVENAYLTKVSNTQSLTHTFIRGISGAVLPRIVSVIFESDEGTVPQDPDLVAISGAYTPQSEGLRTQDSAVYINGSDRDFEGVAYAARRLAGFRNFDRCFHASIASPGGEIQFGDFSQATPSTNSLRILGGNWLMNGCLATGGGVRIGSNATVNFSPAEAGDSAIPGTYLQDFRITAGVDSPDDIVVLTGGQLTTDSTVVRGGYNLPFNMPRSVGTIVDAAGPTLYDPTGFSIADNAVATITPPRLGGMLTITVANGTTFLPQFAGIVSYCCGASLSAVKVNAAGIGGNLSVVTTDVAGTTGTDGNVTVAARADAIKIENRAGGARTFYLTWS